MIENSSLYVLFRQRDKELARLEAFALPDLSGQPWAVFGRHVHLYLHDQLLLAAKAGGASPSAMRSIQTAEEGAQLVSQFGGVAFLTRTGAWRSMEPGLTIRPLKEETLRLQTVIITRIDDDPRLLCEFVRTAMRRFTRASVSQRALAFAS